MSRKNKHVEEHENHERWLVSFADFMTLLFALFTVLYVLANSSAKELEEVVAGMNAAFDGGMPSAMMDVFTPNLPNDLSELAPSPLSLEAAPSVLHSIKQGLVGSLSDNVVQLGLVDQSLTLSLPERMLFAPGSAELHPAAFAPLARIASALAGTVATVEVIGHADGAPVAPGGRWVDNWELATARSLATVRYLQRQGVAQGALTSSATLSSALSADARAVTIRVIVDEPGPAAEVGERLSGG